MVYNYRHGLVITTLGLQQYIPYTTYYIPYIYVYINIHHITYIYRNTYIYIPYIMV